MPPPQTLPLARYRYTVRMHAPLRLPDYAGSLLRGQLGSALRKVSCVTGQASCDGCPLRSTCPYAAIFEAPAPAQHALQHFSHIPNPYVLEPPPLGTLRIERGECLVFNLVLFGRALESLSLINVALQRAFEQGLGRERARGALERIDIQHQDHIEDADTHAWAPVWEHGDSQLTAHVAKLPLAAPVGPCAITKARLTLLTPLRLQQQGQPIRPQALTPRKLIADLLRRVSLLAEFHAGQPDIVSEVHHLVRIAEGLEHQHDMHWYDWSRHSSRQQREMPLGGALGTWELSGDLEPILPWLRIGQWLHVGKNTTLGLGRYQLDTFA